MATNAGAGRPLRLPGFDYSGPLAAHLTFVTAGRVEFFRDADLAKICIEALDLASVKTPATIHVYCVMPDHLHVLIEIGADKKLTTFAKRFKQLSGYRLKQATGNIAWQQSYFDRVLRAEEALEAVADYIWQNPVAAGLVSGWSDYLFSGPPSALEAVRQG